MKVYILVCLFDGDINEIKVSDNEDVCTGIVAEYARKEWSYDGADAEFWGWYRDNQYEISGKTEFALYVNELITVPKE